MEVKPGFRDPEKVRVPFPQIEVALQEINKYKDYVNIFPGPNFVSPTMEVSVVQRRLRGGGPLLYVSLNSHITNRKLDFRY